MTGDVVGPRNDQLRFSGNPGDLRRRVVVGRFALRVCGSFHLPDGLPGARLHCKHVGRIVRMHAVKHLNIQTVAVQQRRGGVAVVEAESSVVGLNITLPDFLAGHRETGQLAVACHDPDMLAVGDCRRRSGVLLAEELIPAVDLPLPKDGTIFAVDGEKKDFVGDPLTRAAPSPLAQSRESLFCRGDEDRVLPHDRRGSAPTRHFRAPQDVLRLRPGRGKIASGFSAAI